MSSTTQNPVLSDEALKARWRNALDRTLGPTSTEPSQYSLPNDTSQSTLDGSFDETWPNVLANLRQRRLDGEGVRASYRIDQHLQFDRQHPQITFIPEVVLDESTTFVIPIFSKPIDVHTPQSEIASSLKSQFDRLSHLSREGRKASMTSAVNSCIDAALDLQASAREDPELLAGLIRAERCRVTPVAEIETSAHRIRANLTITLSGPEIRTHDLTYRTEPFPIDAEHTTAPSSDDTQSPAHDWRHLPSLKGTASRSSPTTDVVWRITLSTSLDLEDLLEERSDLIEAFDQQNGVTPTMFDHSDLQDSRLDLEESFYRQVGVTLSDLPPEEAILEQLEDELG